MCNVKVRHIESLMHMVVSPRFIKVSLIKFIQEFIVVIGGGISYILWEVFYISYFFRCYIMTDP